MKRLLFLSLAVVLLLGFSQAAVAVPITGEYDSLYKADAVWLYPGQWKEEFPGDVGDGSTLTASTFTGFYDFQWSLAMTSTDAEPFAGDDWDWETAYTGSLTLGGNLTTDGNDFVFDNVNAVNLNKDFFRNYPFLSFHFEGEGEKDGYLIHFAATYFGMPNVVLDSNQNPVTASNLSSQDSLLGNYKVNFTITKANVPEPTTMLLLGIGLVGLAGISRKTLKNK